MSLSQYVPVYPTVSYQPVSPLPSQGCASFPLSETLIFSYHGQNVLLQSPKAVPWAMGGQPSTAPPRFGMGEEGKSPGEPCKISQRRRAATGTALGTFLPISPWQGAHGRPKSAQDGMDREAETLRNKHRVWKCLICPQKCGDTEAPSLPGGRLFRADTS